MRCSFDVVAPIGGLTAGGLIVYRQVGLRSCRRRPDRRPSSAPQRVPAICYEQAAGLPEIGQLLRHRSMASTAIYAKVDTVALRALARPWPGGPS